MLESDRDYFQRRAQEERAAADHACHPAARWSHLKLAERYSAVAEAANPAATVVLFEARAAR